MTVPTDEEIEYAYEQITKDGRYTGVPGHITTELSMLVVLSRRVSESVDRYVDFALKNGWEGSADLARGLLTGALIYGLHLGLHIGEERGRIEADKRVWGQGA